MDASVAVKPPERVGVPAFELDAQYDCLGSVGADRVDKRSSVPKVRTINEGPPSLSGPTASQASDRTASTELYVPPRREKDESLQNGCISSFKNSLQSERQSFPLQRLEDNAGERDGLPENGNNSHRKRKRSHTEWAIEDVEAAIGMIIGAAEAVVVGYFIVDASPDSAPSVQHRSICLEAALGLAKARHLCGLDQYDLRATTTVDSSDFPLLEEDFDDETMQDAYADIGMIVGVPEDERQGLTVSTVGPVTESGGNPENPKVCQRHDGDGDDAFVQTFGKEDVREAVRGCELPVVGGSPGEVRDQVKVDELKLKNENNEAEIEELVCAVDPEVNLGDDHRNDTGVVKEMNSAVMIEEQAVEVFTVEGRHCQRDLEPAAMKLSVAGHARETGPSQLVAGSVMGGITVPTETGESAEVVPSWPEDKADETFAKAFETGLANEGAPSHRDTVCPDALLQFGSIVRDIHNKPGRAEGAGFQH